jgi:hypothetical protein
MLDPDLPLTGIGFFPPKSGFVYEDDVLVAMDICEQKYNISAPIDDTLYIQPSNGKLLTYVSVNPPPQEEKTITASDVQQIVTPTSGKLLSKVTVNPPALQNPKSASVTPSKNEDSNFDGYTQAATITPDSGYLAMKSVQVKVPQLEKYNEDLGTPGDTFGGVGWCYDEDPMLNPDTMPTGLAISPSKTGMVYDDYTYRIDDVVATGDDIHYTVETDLGLNEDEGYIDIYPTYGKVMLGAKIRTVAKVITASTEDQVVRPQTYGFFKVTVKPTPTETKTITAGTSSQTVNPTTGKHFSQVTVNPTPTEEKTITASASKQVVTPSSGKHLSKVTVNAVPTESVEVDSTVYSDRQVYPSDGKLLSLVTVKPLVHTQTKQDIANSRTYVQIRPGTIETVDLGAYHNYRYVNVMAPVGDKWFRRYFHEYPEEPLWVNSDPTVNFKGQDITLAYSLMNMPNSPTFFVKVEYFLQKPTYNANSGEYTNATRCNAFFPIEELRGSGKTSSYQPRVVISGRCNGTTYVRCLDTSGSTINITTAYKINVEGTSNAYLIPYRIWGMIPDYELV